MNVSKLNLSGFVFVQNKSNSISCLKSETKAKITNYFFLITIILSGLSSGCGTSQKLEDYPQREIDRPYTLPEGVTRIDISSYFGFFRDEGERHNKSQYFPLPTNFEFGISENASFSGPIGWRYQFLHNPRHTLGAQLRFNFYFGNYLKGADFDFSTQYRLRVLGALALNWTGYVRPLLRMGDDIGSVASLSFYPLIQICDPVAVGASIGYSSVRSVSFIGFPLYEYETFSKIENTFPMSFFVMWNFHKRWNFSANYSWSGFQTKTIDYRFGFLGLSYYWGNEAKKEEKSESESDSKSNS